MGVGDTNGNEATTLPIGMPAPEAAPAPLPWDNVRLGAEPPSSRAAGWAAQRPLLHDGPAATDSLSVIRVTSPRCGHSMNVDTAAIVTRGTGRLAFSAAAPPELIDDVARTFQLSSRDFDGRLVLTGTNGLAPCFAVLRCEQCVQMHLTVVSYGEVQPDRFQLVFEGIAAIDDVTPPVVLDGSAAVHDLAGSGRDIAAGHGSSTEDGATLIDLTAGEPTMAWSGSPTGEVPVARARTRRRGGTAPTPPPAAPIDFGARLAILTGLVVVVIALVWVHLSTWAAWSRSGGLANTGTATVATVVASESFDTGSDKSYSITYTYMAVDREERASRESGEQTVDRATFDAATERRTINVRYDPDDPPSSAIARDDDLTLRYLAVVVLDVAVLLAALRLRPVLRPHF